MATFSSVPTTSKAPAGTAKGLRATLRQALSFRQLLRRTLSLSQSSAEAIRAAQATKPTLPPEAGLFGGRTLVSRAAHEARAASEGRVGRMAAALPDRRAQGPHVMPTRQASGVAAVERLPAHAARAFAAMAKGDHP